MTPRMKKVLDFITSHVEKHGYSPTYREMMAELGMKSASEIHQVVDYLEADGFIIKVRGRARGIELVNSFHRIEQASFRQFLESRGLVDEYKNFLKAMVEMAA
jgi:SOS-response transcriptional repressor LexA